jgi:ABC-type amino acid transport system permease subunit
VKCLPCLTLYYLLTTDLATVTILEGGVVFGALFWRNQGLERLSNLHRVVEVETLYLERKLFDLFLKVFLWYYYNTYSKITSASDTIHPHAEISVYQKVHFLPKQLGSWKKSRTLFFDINLHRRFSPFNAVFWIVTVQSIYGDSQVTFCKESTLLPLHFSP